MMGKGIPADGHTQESQGCNAATKSCSNRDSLTQDKPLGEMTGPCKPHPPAPGSLFAAIWVQEELEQRLEVGITHH